MCSFVKIARSALICSGLRNSRQRKTDIHFSTLQNSNCSRYSNKQSDINHNYIHRCVDGAGAPTCLDAKKWYKIKQFTGTAHSISFTMITILMIEAIGWIKYFGLLYSI
jgi:hypothetical protein